MWRHYTNSLVTLFFYCNAKKSHRHHCMVASGTSVWMCVNGWTVILSAGREKFCFSFSQVFLALELAASRAMSLTLSFRTPQENIWKNGKYKYKYYDNYYSFNIYNDLYIVIILTLLLFCLDKQMECSSHCTDEPVQGLTHTPAVVKMMSTFTHLYRSFNSMLLSDKS